MPTDLTPVRPEHVPDLGRICFEAFATLQDRHGVERDFDSVETASMVVGMLTARPDVAGFAAIDRDTKQLLGSNFLWFSDPVAGVGPITIAPTAQSAGTGRLLMQAVMNEARKRSISQVRLQQEAINTTSLSLYTKLGFDWQFACSLMRLAPAPKDHPDIRPLTTDDLPAIDTISKHHYHTSRVNESAMFLKSSFPGFALERRARPTGYLFPGFLGHGFAETPTDLADLITHAARHTPPMFHKLLVPLTQNTLHRELLTRGCRSLKLFNYMTTGPFQMPRESWIPSVGM